MQTVVIVPFWWLEVKVASFILTGLMFVVWYILFAAPWSPFTDSEYSLPIVCGFFIACLFIGVPLVLWLQARRARAARKLNHDRVYARIAMRNARAKGATIEEERHLAYLDDLNLREIYPYPKG